MIGEAFRGLRIESVVNYAGTATRAGLITLSPENVRMLERCLPPDYRITATRETHWGSARMTECIVEGPLMPPWLWRGLSPLPVGMQMHAQQQTDGFWRMAIILEIDPVLTMTWMHPKTWRTLDDMLTELHRR